MGAYTAHVENGVAYGGHSCWVFQMQVLANAKLQSGRGSGAAFVAVGAIL